MDNYIIVSESTIKQLTVSVNAKIQEGYIPLGGFHLDPPFESSQHFNNCFQTMIHKDVYAQLRNNLQEGTPPLS